MTDSMYASAFPKPVELPVPPQFAVRPPAPGPSAEPRITVPLEVLTLASVCGTVGESVGRHDLRQVRFGRDASCYAVATDSKIMAVARWEEPDCGEPCEFGVSGRLIQAAQRVIADREQYVASVTARPSGITVLGKATAKYAQCFTFADAVEPGKFPAWREVLAHAQKRAASGEVTAGSLRVDPVLWASVGDLFGAVIGGCAQTVMRIRYDGDQHPILYESAGPSPVKLTVLLMPLKGDQ